MSSTQSTLDSVRSNLSKSRTSIQENGARSSRDVKENGIKTRSVHSKSSSLQTRTSSSVQTKASVQDTGAKLKGNDVEDEDKSDGGTYTIDQDSNEVINARLSIDKTFGITTTEHKTFKVSQVSLTVIMYVLKTKLSCKCRFYQLLYPRIRAF